MLSNQILHKTVQDVKRITGLECAVWDMKGICLVMTNEKMISLDADVSEFCKSAQENEKKVSEDVGMFLAYEDEDPCYVFVLKGDSPQL